MKRAQFQALAIKNRRQILKARQHSGLMQKAKLVLYAASVFCLVCVGLAGFGLWKASTGLLATESASNALLAETNKQVDAVGSDAHRTLVEAFLTTMDARKAADVQEAFWSKQVPVLSGQVQDSLTQTNDLLASLTKTSNDLDADSNKISTSVLSATDALKPAINQSAVALTALTGVATQATKVIGDSNIPASLKNINDTTTQIAGMAKSGNHIMDNLDHKVDSTLHPHGWARVEGDLLFGLEITKDLIETRYYLEPATVQLVGSTSAGAVKKAAAAIHNQHATKEINK